MTKGSKRRPGEGYTDAFVKIFGEIPTTTIQQDPDWWLECPECGKTHPHGVAAKPFCDVCKTVRLRMRKDGVPLPVEASDKPVTELDKKRARFVEIHSRDKVR
jgi:hypothetical protein